MILFELFYVFFLIGLFTIGGGYAMIPLMEKEIVGRGWVSLETFYNMISISESTPGPFAINMATFVGYRCSSVPGAILATIGLILPSFIIILIVAKILDKFTENKIVKAILYGFKSAVIGLIVATAITFLVNALYIENMAFNWVNLIEFALILIICIIYKKIKKKALSPYFLIIMGALFGAIHYLINTFIIV